MPIVELPDGREVEFPDSMSQDQMAAAIHKNFPEFAPKAQERSWGQATTDTAVQLGEGVNTILGAIPNLVAPESRAAKFFNDNANYWRGEQSAPLKEKIARADTAISKAGEEGVIAQVVEAAKQYSSDPALAARFVVTNLPSMIPGIAAAKVAQAAALARGASAAQAATIATTAAGGANATLNAGGARGEAFEDVKRTLMNKGVPEAQAEQQAIKDSRLPAAVGGVTGFVSGKTGLEGALVGKAGASNALRRGAASMATELAGEQLEEVAPKLATNYQAGQYDGRDLGQDVGRTIVETAIGSGPGAVVGGVSAARNRPAPLDQPAPAPARPAADVGDVLNANSVDDAIDAAVRATSSPIAGDTPTPADIDALEDLYGSDATGGTAGILGDGAAPDALLGGSEVPAAPGLDPALGGEAAAQLPAMGAADAAGAVVDDGAGLFPAGGVADGQPALTGKFSSEVPGADLPVGLEAAPVAGLGGKNNEAADWHAFPPETGTLSVPRAEMPQIRAEHRGAMTQFLAARGVKHEQVEVDAAQLKPTQAEFSLSKVRAAQEYQGGNRSILVSSDGHVLDGHHQWLAAVEAGQPVKAIVLDAPIAQLLETVREFPSASVDTASASTAPAKSESGGVLVVERDDAATTNYKVMGDGGKQIGSILAQKRLSFIDGRDVPILQVHNAGIDDKAMKGKGYGVRAYVELADRALAQGGQMWSDPSVSPEAQHIYDALKRRGYIIEENPRKPGVRQEDGTLVSDGSYVYRVVGKRDDGASASGDTSSAAPVLGQGARLGQSKLDATARRNQRQEEAVRLAAQSLEARKKTGGQAARERLAAENPFLHFLAEQGLQIDERSDTGGQSGRKGNRMVPGFGPVYRRNGKRLDELAALAVEAGFLTQQDVDSDTDTGGTRKLAEMIERAVHGNEVVQRAASPEASVPGADEQLLAEAARLGIDINGMDADQVYDAVATAHADDFSNNEARALVDAFDDIDLDAGTESTTITDEDLDAIFGQQSRGAQAGGGQTQEGAAADTRGRAQEAEGAREGQDELLTSYSAADVVARQDADAARQQADKDERARADQQRKKEADDKDVRARMDASADNFQLGQSAMDSLSGQEGLRFSVAAEDTASDIPIAFLRSMQVPTQVWNRTESRFETKDMRADQALEQVRGDIDTYQRMIACMKR